MPKAVVALLTVLAVSVPFSTRAEDKKVKKPELTIRATPRFTFSPANILFTAELKGGDDIEEFYCPEVEWDWDDGSRSINEGDCDPWDEVQKIERRFSARHEFRRAGRYRVRVTLSKADDVIVRQTLQVQVRPGVADPQGVY